MIIKVTRVRLKNGKSDFQEWKRENFLAKRDRRVRRLIERIRGTIRKRSIAVELSRTLARRTRGRYVEESYVRIDHVCTWSRDRVALVFQIHQPCRKMKRIIASPRLCTLLDISVHQPLDSDILMPKGSTRRFRLCTVDTSDYICTRMAVYIRTAFEYAHRIYGQSLSAYLLIIIEGESPYASRDMSVKLDQAISDWSREIIRSPMRYWTEPRGRL